MIAVSERSECEQNECNDASAKNCRFLFELNIFTCRGARSHYNDRRTTEMGRTPGADRDQAYDVSDAVTLTMKLPPSHSVAGVNIE